MKLPHDPPLRHHEFGPKMISLCVNLAPSYRTATHRHLSGNRLRLAGRERKGARLDDRSYLAGACGSRGHQSRLNGLTVELDG